MKKSTIVVLFLLIAGVACCIAAACMGIGDITTEDGSIMPRFIQYQEEAVDKAIDNHMQIEHLVLDIDAAECTVQTGSDECSLTGGSDVTWELEGDTLTISQKQKSGWWWKSKPAPITLNIQDVAIAYLDIDVDAGAVAITDLTVTQTVKCNVDAGAAELKNVDTNRLELDVDAGGITYSGRTLGPVKLECDAGGIELDLQNGSTIGQVTGTIDAGEINVLVNGKQMLKRDGFAETISAQLPGAIGVNVLTFDCDAGSISVELTAKEIE